MPLCLHGQADVCDHSYFPNTAFSFSSISFTDTIFRMPMAFPAFFAFSFVP